MGFLLGFGLLLAGYSLVDWGYQRAKSRKVSMWYLVSGQGAGPSTTQSNEKTLQTSGKDVFGKPTDTTVSVDTSAPLYGPTNWINNLFNQLTGQKNPTVQ